MGRSRHFIHEAGDVDSNWARIWVPICIWGITFRGRAYRLPFRRVTIGSDPRSDICVVHDPNVSREHAELIAEDHRVCLIDLASNTGTRVDGEPIARYSLRGGERVEVGWLKFSVAKVWRR